MIYDFATFVSTSFYIRTYRLNLFVVYNNIINNNIQLRDESMFRLLWKIIIDYQNHLNNAHYRSNPSNKINWTLLAQYSTDRPILSSNDIINDNLIRNPIGNINDNLPRSIESLREVGPTILNQNSNIQILDLNNQLITTNFNELFLLPNRLEILRFNINNIDFSNIYGNIHPVSNYPINWSSIVDIQLALKRNLNASIRYSQHSDSDYDSDSDTTYPHYDPDNDPDNDYLYIDINALSNNPNLFIPFIE